MNIRGKASEPAIVSVNNEQVTKTAGYFFKSLSVDNAATAKLTEVNVSAVIPGATPNDPDQVDEVNGKVFTPKASQTVTYDDDGNLTNDGRWSYSWDGENRLVGMTKTFAAEEPMSLSFQYDENGRRKSKTVVTGTGGSATTKTVFFAWDGWILAAEWQVNAGEASNIKSFLWGLDLSGSETEAGGIGGLISVGQDGAKYLPVADALGNIRTIVDGGGAKVSGIDYGPFGEPLGELPEYCPFAFSSKYTDIESGLLYYGYRYYNPETGRWVNRDPIEERGGVNLYGFVVNDPISLFDLVGLKKIDLGEFAEAVAVPTQYGISIYGSYKALGSFDTDTCCAEIEIQGRFGVVGGLKIEKKQRRRVLGFGYSFGVSAEFSAVDLFWEGDTKFKLCQSGGSQALGVIDILSAQFGPKAQVKGHGHLYFGLGSFEATGNAQISAPGEIGLAIKPSFDGSVVKIEFVGTAKVDVIVEGDIRGDLYSGIGKYKRKVWEFSVMEAIFGTTGGSLVGGPQGFDNEPIFSPISFRLKK